MPSDWPRISSPGRDAVPNLSVPRRRRASLCSRSRRRPQRTCRVLGHGIATAGPRDPSSRARRSHGVVRTPLPAGHHQPAAETPQDGVQRHLFLHRRCPPARDGGIGLGHRLRLPHTRCSQVLRAPGSPRRCAIAHGGVSADLPEVILAAGEECHGLARRHSCRSLPTLSEEHV